MPMHSDLNPKKGLMAAESDLHLLKVVLESISAVVIVVVLSVPGDVEQAVSRRGLAVVVAAVLGDCLVPGFGASAAAEAAIAALQCLK